uniref:VWFA domain-containing protein n=1 Tax=Rhodosorus marinus TaxID=101924 RepID=A0A7S2Z9E6_9RHOD|mmetsp:Transcript_10164/g.42618  ORF Transcript_10164/g.42618 Transcript_10164/m.42618 type:complete len:409 (+) Transcript_10164:194-1420(+)|eukprot:CAMPEP_0113957118 /NCGR_PEP_ID=MMETSP0011_2-20120614/2547_1 /TAXON_ID=101924 /ORGANISM="Rhodosorus marinus" /LENGTH=408 /DNA_ID=CAMNT_0000967555 /DNA_START=103 /DNA_END=1329 /DNA_ORIENTATION=+ /assembly_acc=CAM_ASM_000156
MKGVSPLAACAVVGLLLCAAVSGEAVLDSKLMSARENYLTCDHYASMFDEVKINSENNLKCFSLCTEPGEGSPKKAGLVCLKIAEVTNKTCIKFMYRTLNDFIMTRAFAGASSNCDEKPWYPFQKAKRFDPELGVKTKTLIVCLDSFDTPPGADDMGCCNTDICVAAKLEVAYDRYPYYTEYAFPPESNKDCITNGVFRRCTVELLCSQSCDIDTAAFCFAVDVSQSLWDPVIGGSVEAFQSQIDFVAMGIEAIENNGGVNLEYGVVAFGDDGEVIADLTTAANASEAVSEIAVPTVKFGTNIESALSTCEAVLSGSPKEFRVLILITDGVPTVGNTSSADLEAQGDAIKDAGIQIVTIGAGDFIDANLLNNLSTSGSFISVDSITDFTSALNDLLEEVCERSLTVPA